METSIFEANVNISFEDSFPKVGEEREIVKKDGTEWLIYVVNVSNHRWDYENGQVIGAIADMEYQFIEEVRPSSKGKLRLV